MMFELNFKDFKNLSNNKLRIMLWSERATGYELILIDENAKFKTFIEYDKILQDYSNEVGKDFTIKNLDDAKNLFKKKFIKSREHTYEYYPNGIPKEEYDGLVQIENPIDESENNEILELKEDAFVDYENNEGGGKDAK